jgi:hypothetical protein
LRKQQAIVSAVRDKLPLAVAVVAHCWGFKQSQQCQAVLIALVLLLTRMCLIAVLGLNSRRSRAVLIGPAAAVASAAGCAACVAAAEVLLQRCLACAVGSLPAKGCSCCTGLASTRLIGSCMLQARHARMLCRQVCITAKMVLLWLRLLLKLQREHNQTMM